LNYAGSLFIKSKFSFISGAFFIFGGFWVLISVLIGSKLFQAGLISPYYFSNFDAFFGAFMFIFGAYLLIKSIKIKLEEI